MIVVSYQNETKIKTEFAAQQPGDEIELIMTDSSFPNGQETRTFITQQSRKISQNSSFEGGYFNNLLQGRKKWFFLPLEANQGITLQIPPFSRKP